MRKTLMTALFLMANMAAAGTTEGFKLISAGDLATVIQQKSPSLVIFDVNNAKTRKEDGVIPGAKLLPSTQYDVAKELPANKASKLVFYCANTKCMSSHSAAELAVKAGYSDVSVMKDGIQGWKKTGHPSQPSS